jgi:hypothetical protein
VVPLTSAKAVAADTVRKPRRCESLMMDFEILVTNVARCECLRKPILTVYPKRVYSWGRIEN